MGKQSKAHSKSSIETSDNSKKPSHLKNDVRFGLYIICGYVILIAISLFFTCPEAIKLTLCFITGLIISLFLISINITKISSLTITIKNRILFIIIIGLSSSLATYVYAFSIPFVKDFYRPLQNELCCNCDSITLKLISSGEYNVGLSANNEIKIANMFPNMSAFWANEKPQHCISLDSFLISEYEITNEIYSYYTQERKISFSVSIKDRFKPVNNINWNEAKEFCKWLGRKTGQNVDLPTENQWEAAAGTNIFPWGNDYPQIIKANFNSAFYGPTPVDSIKNYSDFGIINMAGNVAEWCLDNYSNYSNSPNNKNSLESSIVSRKIVRGGSWEDNAFDIRVSKRNSYPADTKNNKIGFRIVINNKLKTGGKIYENKNFRLRDSNNAVIIICRM